MDSGRRGSTASSVAEVPEEIQMTMGPSKHDILADLSKLQAEIDALRSQSEKEGVIS